MSDSNSGNCNKSGRSRSRGRGGGNILEQADGRWCAAVSAGYGADCGHWQQFG